MIASFTRLYPLKSGCLKVAELSILQKLAVNNKTASWVHAPGGDVRVYINELIGRTVYFLGDLDKRLTWISNKLIKKGDTVLDIGANVGIMSLLFSKNAGINGRVIAFEPHPRIYNDLDAAIKKNQTSNITAYQLGLGSVPGEFVLNVPHSNLGLGSLIRSSTENCDQYIVQVETLDKIIDDSKIKKIDFMKIDVEGFEYNVLKGAHNTLEKTQPKVIVFELNNFAGKVKDHKVIKLLSQYDYKFISIPKCLFKMYTRRLDLDKNSEDIGNDVVAVLSSHYEEVSKCLNMRK